jgi:hypothetical protein
MEASLTFSPGMEASSSSVGSCIISVGSWDIVL